MTFANPSHAPEHAPEHEHEHEHEHDDPQPAAKPRCCGEAHSHGVVPGFNVEMLFAVLCGLALALGWGLDAFTAVAWSIPLWLYLAAFFFGGFFTVIEAWGHVRRGAFDIDSLMLIAAIGAATLGHWAEGALLLFLFSLGHALENYAMGRARRAIEALAHLAPDTARVRRDGEMIDVPVEELVVGDAVVVRPDERLPADGYVTAGHSSVDQSPITGESIPVDKEPVAGNASIGQLDTLDAKHRVFAGTINGSGLLEVYVTRRASQSTLARVVEMVSQAEAHQSPTQRFTDRFERIFVPCVLGFVVLLLFAFLVVDETFGASFYRAMAVLVASSPCALAISTPSAVLSGVARGGRGGVLIKGGGPLEDLGRLTAIAFDKTGTMTQGRPRLSDVRPAAGVEEATLLRVAAAAEALSHHPLARAVVRDAAQRLDGEPLLEAADLRSITGRGIAAVVEAETVWVGKDALFFEGETPPLPDAVRGVARELEEAGRTTMIVLHGGRYLGVLGMMDTPREAAAAVIRRLREMGIRRTIMLSGDNQRVVDAVAREVGIDDAWGDLMPQDKVDRLQAVIESGGGVAMVGDGVNDAPAMARATVGIAMGAAGSDVALETADVALMADDLTHLPFAVALSRKTRTIIVQNLWISLGMIAVLVPLTLLGLHIGAAVALHEGSTLIVVLNALRLLVFQPPSV